MDAIYDEPLACLRQVLAAAPALTDEGWTDTNRVHSKAHVDARTEMLRDESIEEFIRATHWLDLLPAQKTINRRRSSYGWKHIAEDWYGRQRGDGRCYISNGMFIAGCIALGRRIEPVRFSLNPYVAIPELARTLP